MKSRLHLLGSAAALLLAHAASGCGTSEPVPDPKTTTPTAITDYRLHFKEEYRKAIGKNGRLAITPEMMKKYQAKKAQSARP